MSMRYQNFQRKEWTDLEKRHIVIASLSALMLTSAIALVNNSSRLYRLHTNLEKGKSCYESMDYEKAIDYFDMVLEDDNKNVDAYYFKANSLIKSDNYDSAIAVIEYGYKMTKESSLERLKDKIMIYEDEYPKEEQQSVMTNVTLEDVPGIEFEINSESSVVTTEIDITPDVETPKYIPKVTTKETTLEVNVYVDVAPPNVNVQPPEVEVNVQQEAVTTQITSETEETVSTLVNVDGAVSDDEFEVYDSWIDEIIERLLDGFFERLNEDD